MLRVGYGTGLLTCKAWPSLVCEASSIIDGRQQRQAIAQTDLRRHTAAGDQTQQGRAALSGP
jgi:hypothetical protein